MVTGKMDSLYGHFLDRTWKKLKVKLHFMVVYKGDQPFEDLRHAFAHSPF